MYFASMSSDRYQVINDLGNIPFVGGLAAFVLAAIPPALCVFILDTIVVRLGYNEIFAQFIFFSLIVWNYWLKTYFAIDLRLLWIPTWILFFIFPTLNTLGITDEKEAVWTWTSFACTLFLLIVITISGNRKKNRMESDKEIQEL